MKKNNAKVSVIVPNYNHAKFLRRRMASIFQQTFNDYEVIFLDDASTDNSVEVFKEFSNHKTITKAIFNKKNSGSVFKQWHKGIMEAKGEYLWIAESDDYCDETFLQRMVCQLDANQNLGIVYCQSWVVDENDTILFNNQQWTEDLDPDRWLHDYSNVGIEEVKNYLVFKNTIANTSSALIRKSVYDEIKEAPEGFDLCGDWFLWVNILLLSDLYYVAKPLNYFRRHNNTVRYKNEINGYCIKEIIKMSAYISSHVNLTGNTKRKAMQLQTSYWAEATLKGVLSVSMQREIYKEAIRFGFLVNFYFLGNVMLLLMHKIRMKLGIRTRIKYFLKAMKSFNK